MPAPDAAIVAYAVIVLVPVLLLGWYWTMYGDIGRSGLTGGRSMGSEPEPDPEGEAEPEA